MNLEEICEKLQSDERRLKQTTLQELQHYCEDTGITSDLVLATFDECYLHLLKCYGDRYESVREQATQTVTAFIKRLPPNDFHLLNIITTLAERMGKQETVEESEEIRLLQLQQLHVLIKSYVEMANAHSLEECYADIVRILAKAVRDAYPAVQREACACIVQLASSAETCVFEQWAEKLATALYSMLNHKHSLARIAAIDALGHLALHINASGDELSRLLMEISPLLMDLMPLVRRECGQLGVLLLLELRDRYSYFDRIIPLVLSCLKDDAPEVSDHTRPLWVQCGKQYYEENEMELSKEELGDLPADNYPKDVQRPTIGCRGLVQRSLRLLKLITRESSDWKENVRLHSLKLLYQFVLHAEAAMTAKFFEIYPDVARSCCDSEKAVVNEALKVADLMGRLFCYEDWCEHGFDGLSKNVKEGYLKCFYQMFTAAMGVKWKDVLKLSKMLAMPEFSQTLKPHFQLYVLRMLVTLLDKVEETQTLENTMESSMNNLQLHGEDTIEEFEKYVYISVVKIMALSYESQHANAVELQETGNAILERLVLRQNSNLAFLHEKYFVFALEYVQNLDAPLDALSEPILLLYGLLSNCKFRASYLTLLQAKINDVCLHCADEAKVKIFTAVSVAMLNWQETVGVDEDKSSKLLQTFSVSVIEPHLIWCPGANAEAMRSLATATLCAIAQNACAEAATVLPAFSKYLPGLLEDHATATRYYAVKCVLNICSLPVEQLKAIAYGTLQRLDDPSSDIRILAALSISKLSPKFAEIEADSFKHELAIWSTFIQKAIDMLLLHYEGPEVRLQAAIKETILTLSSKYPEICKDSLWKTLAMSYGSNTRLKELQAELSFTV